MQHEIFMQRCLSLAENGRGRVGNSALCGAVLVRAGEILEVSWYSIFGDSHSEHKLLKKYEQEISSEDVLYVSLEPCCHHGKTPPCTQEIVRRGIKKVVIGMQDPDKRVSGKGIAELRAAGITVIGPVLRAACEHCNRGFISARTKGRPFITLKRAETLSGDIAEKDGSRLKVTSMEQDAWSHEFLRVRSDAILVGVETVIRDDPTLNIRHSLNKNSVQPVRIILDPSLRIPHTSVIVQTTKDHQTLVITRMDAPVDRINALRSHGVLVRMVPYEGTSFIWSPLFETLLRPVTEEHYVGVTSILVEGGKRTWEHFQLNSLVDEEVILVGDSLPAIDQYIT